MRREESSPEVGRRARGDRSSERRESGASDRRESGATDKRREQGASSSNGGIEESSRRGEWEEISSGEERSNRGAKVSARGRGKLLSLRWLSPRELPGTAHAPEVWRIDARGEWVKDRDVIRQEVRQKDWREVEMGQFREKMEIIRPGQSGEECIKRVTFGDVNPTRTDVTKTRMDVPTPGEERSEAERECRAMENQLRQTQRQCCQETKEALKKEKNKTLAEIRRELRKRETIWLEDMVRRFRRQAGQESIPNDEAWGGEGSVYLTLPDPNRAYVVMEGHSVEEAGLFLPFKRLEL